MPALSRRDFLRCLGIGLGSLAGGPLLAGCRPAPAGAPASPLPASPAAETSAPPAATVQPASPAFSPGTATAPAPTAAPTAGIPDLVVARGGTPEALVRQALAALGGIEQFVRPGDDVILKPNICVAYHSYEYAATTNPWVVGALVSLCREAGAGRVRVMDLPFGGSPAEAYAVSGIQEQVLAAGGQMEVMSGLKYQPTDLPQAVDLRRTDIYGDILQADVVINVPIAKHHSLARLTLGMKNLMGVIRDRAMMHQNLGQRLADLASRIRPALTVVDAVRILRDHGPSGGSLDDVQQLDTLIASRDIVAADSYAATLFGLQPGELAYIRAGEALGLGRSDLAGLRIEEIAVEG